MKAAICAWAVSCLLIVSCGKESKSDSNDSGDDAAKPDGEGTPDGSAEGPGNINAALFTSLIPKIRSEGEIEVRLSTTDLTNFTAATANKNCVNGKVTLTADGSGYFVASLPSTDVTSCFAASEFSGYSEIKVTFQANAKLKLSIDGTAVDLNGKTMAEGKALLEANATGVYEAEQFIQSVFVLAGKVKGNGNDEIITRRNLLQNGDGATCKIFKIKDGPHTEDVCQSYESAIQTLNGQVNDEKLMILQNAKAITADSYTSTYFQKDQEVSLKLDNWSGTIKHKGADEKPSYLLTDGGAGKVESLEPYDTDPPEVEDIEPPATE